ncbi:hypothetical protein K1719_042584 [Acacia pycnantha]|nr:hypothetical protein K1719_042584 [Acacia pycnantha]
MHNQQDPQDSFFCPNFTSYSIDKLVDIADQVDHKQFHNHDNAAIVATVDDSNYFEFVTFQKASNEVFLNGHVGPVRPIFDRDLLTNDEIGPRRGFKVEEDAVMIFYRIGKL